MLDLSHPLQIHTKSGWTCGLGVVAIPANNEAARIEACLSALAVQRNGQGEPIATGQFEVIIFANNCEDDTALLVRTMAETMPFPVCVVEETFPAAQCNAGGARKRSMDLAANRLMEDGELNGFILTTDADSCVCPTWFSATKSALEQGVDCVAGYIDASPVELTRLGAPFLSRGRLEDRYLAQVSEIYAICDPRPHDPWPNHRVSSGASLAVRLEAYLAIGGLPAKPVGEDAALTQVLEQAGYKIRHAMDVSVSTSCRFDGRAKGGAADTMQHRHAVIDAPCDDDLEPALATIRRALIRERLRRSNLAALSGDDRWARRLGLSNEDLRTLVTLHTDTGFLTFWEAVQEASTVLARGRPLHPSDLPREIRRAEKVLQLLRGSLA